MPADTTYAPIPSADEADHDGLVAVLTAAFAHDPLADWIFGHADDRAALQSAFYRSLLGHPRAEAYLAGDGAAVWLRLRAGERLHDDAPGHGPAARLAALGRALAERHPADRPHLYLAVMGVTAAHRGRGTGTALLRDRLARADRVGIPAYLEAGSPRARALYRRHGFEDLGEPVRVADAPTLYPMWRPPIAARR